MRHPEQILPAAALLLAALVMTACQPSPEERLARAEAYIDRADYRTAAIELRNLLQVSPDDGRARLLLAEASYQLGDFQGAESQFERAISLGQTESKTWVAFGRVLLSQGRAVSAFERVVPNVDEQADDASVQVFLGDVLLAMGQPEKAFPYYERSMQVDPTQVHGLIGLAMVEAARGNAAQAEQVLAAASEIDPSSPSVELARGRLHEADREHTEAAAAFGRALELSSPKTPLAEAFATRMSYVSALIDSRQLENAEIALSDFVNRFPDHPVSGFLSGRLAFVKGDYERAQLEMQNYLAKNPGDGRGQALLGAINFSQDNLRQAEANLLAAIRANAGSESTRRLLAETRLRLDDPEGALDVLRASGSGERTDAVILSMLGRASALSGSEQDAIEYFRRGLESDPGNDAVRFALASSYLRSSRAAEAVEILDSMPLQPGSELRRQTLLIAALIRQGEDDRAMTESNRLLAARPDEASSYIVAGALWQSKGNIEHASASYEQALSLDPESVDALFSLSQIALLEGRIDIAEARLRELLSFHPAHVPAVVSLGLILQDKNDLASLEPFVARAIDRAPDLAAPRIVMARLELARGRPDEAIRAINAAEKLSRDPDLDHLRGLALLAKGENEGALRSLLVAASAAPGSPAIQFDLGQAQLLTRQFDAASKTGEMFCGLLPDDLRCPVLLGDIELARGNGASAADYYRDAADKSWSRVIAMRLARAESVAGSGLADRPLATWLQEHPGDHEVRRMYARVLESQDSLDAAIREYESLLAADQLDAVGMNNLAWQYSRRGDGRAEPLAERAHSLAPDDGSIADTLGWILVQRGELQRAVPLLRQAARQLSGNPDVRYHLAEALALAGEKEEARSIISDLLRTGEPFSSRADAERLSARL